MDINKVVSLLEQFLSETEDLRTQGLKKEEFELWRNKVLDILEAGFGKKSTEFDRFATAVTSYHSFYTEQQQKEEYDRRLILYETALKSIIQKYKLLGIEEKPLVKEKEGLVTPIKIFDALKLHTEVVEASRELFEDGHYRDAIYRAFVEVNNFVKSKANSQLDGKKLMSTVFSLEKPVIKLNPLQTQSDRDEQEGFMFLFMGAMEGIRNPKAHENIIQNDPNRTLEYLGLASLLMKITEEGTL
jgi:uncharacterized protein (TIGR02391 family)